MLLLLTILLCAHAGEGVLIRAGGQVAPASAAQATGVVVSDARPISLDLQDADIHSVLRLISSVSGLNFVCTDDVRGAVTVRLVDVPWDQALAVILQARGLAATPLGPNVVTVAPLGG